MGRLLSTPILITNGSRSDPLNSHLQRSISSSVFLFFLFLLGIKSSLYRWSVFLNAREKNAYSARGPRGLARPELMIRSWSASSFEDSKRNEKDADAAMSCRKGHFFNKSIAPAAEHVFLLKGRWCLQGWSSPGSVQLGFPVFHMKTVKGPPSPEPVTFT